MSLSDKQKLDHIWKRLEYNVAQTYHLGKEPNNEILTSKPMLLPQNFWAEAESIPAQMPSENTGILDIHKGATAIRCRMDITSPLGKTWVAVQDYGSITETNRLKDWVNPVFDPSYGIKVWAGDPMDGGVLINLQNEFREAIFDYSAGVLHFYGTPPTSVINDGVWIEGARYIGPKGIDGIIVGIQNRMPELGKSTQYKEINFSTNMLNSDQSATDNEQRFTLETGSHFILRSLIVDAPCLIECHDSSRYDDSNPYAFVATSGHFVDDGSYVMGNQRYYGPKYVTLFNREDREADFSHWKIKNLDTDSRSINLFITITKIKV